MLVAQTAQANRTNLYSFHSRNSPFQSKTLFARLFEPPVLSVDYGSILALPAGKTRAILRKERGIFRRKTESRRRNFQILAIAASAASFFPVSDGNGSAVPAACRRRRNWLPMGRPGIAAARRRGQEGQGHQGFLPLLTPQPFLRTRLPSVARLNARGPQMRLVLQEYTIDRSGAFRSRKQTPCTGWPRTVMRGALRKENSGPNSVPKPARRTEPSPCFSRFAARPKGVAAQRKVWGVKRGQGNHTVPLPLFAPRRGHGLPRRRTAAILPTVSAASS